MCRFKALSAVNASFRSHSLLLPRFQFYNFFMSRSAFPCSTKAFFHFSPSCRFSNGNSLCDLWACAFRCVRKWREDFLLFGDTSIDGAYIVHTLEIKQRLFRVINRFAKYTIFFTYNQPDESKKCAIYNAIRLIDFSFVLGPNACQ